MEASQLKQRLEEGLRQRERELTALKGVLKDEVASHDRDMESLREQYSTDMEKLRSSMEQVSQVHARTHAHIHAHPPGDAPCSMELHTHQHSGVGVWGPKGPNCKQCLFKRVI